MENKAIKTESDYKKAVKELERIGDDQNFGDDSNSILKFEELANLIKQYETTHYFLEVGDPIEIIKLKMDYMGLTRADLIPYMGGSKGIVSEVFNKKRGLSKTMIRNLSQLLKIEQNILNIDEGTKIIPIERSVKKDSSSIFKLKGEIRTYVDNFQHSVINRGYVFNICSK